ncbi:Ribonuclease H2 subunit B [Madurella fahalii]|uniref:Ribonuclease H2 subunit B n=1 Tax=Madurella fahalii TaxID=1157608 RepID=A0ABQ0GE20_9PEZI
MARTRASKGAAGAATAQDKTATSKPNNTTSIYALPAESDNPPKLFILPKNTTPEARIVTLQNPRYSRLTRYLVCPEAGFFEFTKVSPPSQTPRSWLLASNNDSTAETTQSPTLYVATPLDPFFLLLPALSASPEPTQKKRMFTSLDDHLDLLPNPARHLSEILTWPRTQALVAARLAAACDTVEAGGETMYRFSEDKVLREVLGKARRMAESGAGNGSGLPRSMEERFVKRALEAPVVGVRVVRQNANGNGSGSGMGTPEAGAESQGSSGAESAVETGVSSESEASTAPTSVADEDGAATGIVGEDVVSAMVATEEVVKLQRLRVAFNFICSSYIAPPMAEVLKGRLDKATDLVDFKPLDEYQARLAKLRQDAAAARSTDYSRKRTMDEEEDGRAEKRRKKEAEEKVKKANQSRGVKELMKVNTSGMKKLSEFFKKKT